MSQLRQEDYDLLIRLLISQPDYQNAARRFSFLQEIFSETDRKWDILGFVDMDGPARIAAGDMLNRLATFGQIAPGVLALAPLVEELQHRYRTDPEIERLLKELHQRHLLRGNLPPSLLPFVQRWKGDTLQAPITIAHIEEKIIGAKTFEDIAVLECALRAAASVLKITLPDLGSGSGFLVAPHLVMTNHHVLENEKQAAQAVFCFNYQLTTEGTLCPLYETRFVPGGLFHTNSDRNNFDYTIVEIEPVTGFEIPLTLVRQILNKDARVPIIQHPDGQVKKIAMRENLVAYADADVVQYFTATESGSSGSPVFNERYEVVALHHQGGMLVEPGSKRRYYRNEGISLRAILDDLERNAPPIYRLLTVK